jgi:hypothetical protein
METDDPRLVEQLKKLDDQLAAFDQRMLTVLKTHLAAEQCMNELLKAKSKPWKDRKFAGKLDLCEQIKHEDLPAKMWEVLRRGNKLRNAVAHADSEGAINQRMTDLRKALIDWVAVSQKDGIKTMTDEQMVTTAFKSAGSFITVARLKLEGKY